MSVRGEVLSESLMVTSTSKSFESGRRPRRPVNGLNKVLITGVVVDNNGRSSPSASPLSFLLSILTFEVVPVSSWTKRVVTLGSCTVLKNIKKIETNEFHPI